MDFRLELRRSFAYSCIHTNAHGKVTHCETHVNSDYNGFPDVAICEHGPHKESADDDMRAAMLKLPSGGIGLQSITHKI